MIYISEADCVSNVYKRESNSSARCEKSISAYVHTHRHKQEEFYNDPRVQQRKTAQRQRPLFRRIVNGAAKSAKRHQSEILMSKSYEIRQTQPAEYTSKSKRFTTDGYQGNQGIKTARGSGCRRSRCNRD